VIDALDLFLVSIEGTLGDAMLSINQTAAHAHGRGIALIVGSDRELAGVLTDGDIRRALLNGSTAKTAVREVMVRRPITAAPDTARHLLLRLFDRGVRQIPLVDDSGRIVDLLLYEDFVASTAAREGLLRAKAPARISFAGGGTDFTENFENARAAVISATIDSYCFATLGRRSDRRIVLESSDFVKRIEVASVDELAYDGDLDLLKAAVRLVHPDYGFDLFTSSEVPPGSGLGSSSAMAVAVIGILYHACHGYLDEYHVADLAYQAERVELRIRGGWQDQYAASFGGLNLIEFRHDDVVVHPLQLAERTLHELESNLILCFTGRTRDSGRVHAAIESDERDRHSQKQLELVDATKRALLKGRLDEFGGLLHEAWLAKRATSKAVSTERIDELYAIARTHGALGGKLLGAGGGGYFLLYCEPTRRIEVKRALEEMGAQTTSFKLEPRGLRIWRSPHLAAR
jgi:D-glycero-alpha-D-manno-heptose-7-phosphate kinase